MTTKIQLRRGAAAALLLSLALTGCGSGSTSANDIAADTCDLLEGVDMEALIGEAFEAAFGEDEAPAGGSLAKFERKTEALEQKAEDEGITEDEIAEAMEKKCPDTVAEWKEFADSFENDGSEDSEATPGGSDAAASADASGAGPAVLPDTPQAYSNLLVIGDESALPVGTDGELTAVAIGTAAEDDSSIPVLVRNLTDEPVSNLQASGRAIDANGNVVGSGSSQGFEPNVVEPGGYAIGYVYIDTNDVFLPKGTTVEDLTIDSTPGLDDYATRVAVDVEDLEKLPDGSFTGDVVNPHDITVSGPISVAVLCLGPKGDMTHLSDYADRDELAAGDSSTFTITVYGSKPACDVTLIGASGYAS